MAVFSKGQRIGGYTVTFPVKTGACAETYRVKDASGKNYFLKLFDRAGDILEIEISRQLKHPNLTAFHDSGDIVSGGRRMAYVVYDFISGETAADRIARLQRCNAYEARQIVLGVLEGVKFLHDLPAPVLHNELTVQNVMLDLSADVLCPKVIDFGHACFRDRAAGAFHKKGLNPFYMAPEAFNGNFSVQTDLYSVGALLYHLLFGLPPFYIDLSRYKSNPGAAEEAILAEKRRTPKFPDAGRRDTLGTLLPVIVRALSPEPDGRFRDADEFIRALSGGIKVRPAASPTGTASAANLTKRGRGFADVAGMKELKEQLQSDVIDLLKQPEEAEALGLQVPNGLLFYGPPGCGKTYFAEKFAEELGCNYQYVKCSDIASPYIHGGQGKIAAIFDEARQNAPTILFFDEIEAMVTDRSKQTNVSESGEVNEFLAQLNNCGRDRVIVIGATNKPSEIDEAALRAGRLEYKYYIPQPDLETREELFRIELARRKTGAGIDYAKLAAETENYVSADIRLIVDTAARLVFRRHLGSITMEVLEEAVRNVRPSVSLELLRQHEAIRDAFQGLNSAGNRKKIGF